MKMLLQNGILPCAYKFWQFVWRGRDKDRILFADAHHSHLPVSMEEIYGTLERKGYLLTDFFWDFGEMSPFRSAWLCVRFMGLYARAKYVFICDNFLPVSSCKKDEGTKVIQLWHACGLVKKMGCDTTEDIPAGYRGNVYRNYDLVTVSAPCCVAPMAGAMGLPRQVLQPLGVSRTDAYFREDWRDRCRAEFYEKYPQARGKKILLWAPTFRGNAADPYQVGAEEIRKLEKQLGADYFMIRKLHPHVEGKGQLSSCAITTERLLPVVDLLITDYSSVLTEFLFFEKPCVLFAPDLWEYEKKRGFYVEYRSLSPYVVTDPGELYRTCLNAMEKPDRQWLKGQRQLHLASCDGHATERILAYLGL